LSFDGPTSVDLENSVPRVEPFYRKTFSIAEQSWVTRAAGADKFSSDWLFTFLWTLKESALKLQTDQTLWDLPRIEIGDLPEPEHFSQPRNDRTFVDHFSTFPVSVRNRQRTNRVQVAVTGSRNLILTLMKPLSGVIN
jgi:phosphopantetheinyl transferase